MNYVTGDLHGNNERILDITYGNSILVIKIKVRVDFMRIIH